MNTQSAEIAGLGGTTSATNTATMLPIVYDGWNTSPNGIVIHPATVSLVSQHPQQPNQPMVAILHPQSSPIVANGASSIGGFQVPISPNGQQFRQLTIHSHDEEVVQQQNSTRNQLKNTSGDNMWSPKVMSPVIKDKSPQQGKDGLKIMSCLDRKSQTPERMSTEQNYYNNGEC